MLRIWGISKYFTSKISYIDSLKKIYCISNLRAHIKYYTKKSSSSLVFFYGLNQLFGHKFTVEALGPNVKSIIRTADDLYDQQKFVELFDFLIQYKDCNDDEILWRLARAIYEKSKGESKTGPKKELLSQSFDLLKAAHDINANNFAVHKWLAVVMDSYYSLESTKQRILHLYDMKGHMEKACDLKPMDGTSWYVLGMWYFGIANITWYERKTAQLFFANPPSASFEDALKCFQRAEQAEPGFYSMNYLMLGKCLYHLNKMDEAKEYFTKAKNYPAKTDDDAKARREAQDFLSKL